VLRISDLSFRNIFCTTFMKAMKQMRQPKDAANPLTDRGDRDRMRTMNLDRILTTHRDRMIGEWIHRLHTEVSGRYRERPLDELWKTVSRANDAFFTALVENDRSKIDEHIEWITDVRLKGGFSLSEVQNAYELYRTVLLPILVEELTGEDLTLALRKLNGCLFYGVARFSNYFQSVHEKQIRKHAEDLEEEIKKRTGELAESEAKYRILVEEINDGYFVNQKGTIVFANEAFCDLHGYTFQELIGKPYTSLVAPKSLSLVRELYEKRVSGKEPLDLYFYYRRHKDGRELPTENKVKRIVYQGGQAVAGICRDITERMETEKRIRESERLAHIGKLTASLAHEIRNPLSAVKMNIPLILKNTKFSGNDKRRMEIIVQEVSRLERILDEMLDFARPVRLNMEFASVNEVIDSCLDILDAKIHEKGIWLRKKYSLRLPKILLDREKIEQAILNVLLNAVEVLHVDGTIEIVTKQSMQNGRTLRIDISDDGPGINPEDLPYVFDPFYSNRKKGTGLGLTNVKKIIEAHGGTSSMTIRKPHGAKVSLVLPLREIR
jgi:PAS domain S-box-containing protein